MKFRYSIAVCLLMPFLFACSDKGGHPVPPENPDKPIGAVYDTLMILSTNDVHAHIGNIPKEAAYIQSMKKAFSNVLVVSAGDLFSGDPVVDQYEERGFPIIDLMNRMDYRAMAVGNHDFDYGQDILKERIQQADFPFLCANADFSNTVLDGMIASFDTIRVGGLKVALLGIVQRGASSGIPSTYPDNVKNIPFTNALQTAFLSQWTFLRNWSDVFVVLSHLGDDDDLKLIPLFASKPDVIIGGHSHTVINPGRVNGDVLVTQAGTALNYIGRTMLVLKDKQITFKANTLIDVANLTAEDADIKSRVQAYQDNPKLKELIGQATAAFSGKETIANLMTDALTDQLDCDIAFTNSGGVRLSNLPAGDITLGKVYEIDPFENLTMVYTMSLSELQALLKYTSYYVTAGDPNNFNLYISGAKYTYHIANKTVAMTDYNGASLSASRMYKVAMSTYVAETYLSKISHADTGILHNVSTASLLADYIRAKQTISPQGKRAFSE